MSPDERLTRHQGRYGDAFRAFVRCYWEAELKRWTSVTAAARENGISRTQLHYILNRIGLRSLRRNGHRGNFGD